MAHQELPKRESGLGGLGGARKLALKLGSQRWRAGQSQESEGSLGPLSYITEGSWGVTSLLWRNNTSVEW